MTDANVSVSFSASVARLRRRRRRGEGRAAELFGAPFGEINGQLASLASASSQAFSAERLQPYRDALAATPVARAVASPPTARAPQRPCARATTRPTPTQSRAAQTRERRKKCDSSRTDSSRSSRSTPKKRASTQITQQREARAVAQGARRGIRGSNSPRCKEREALGEQSLAAKAARRRHDHRGRRDDATTRSASLTRSALQEQEREYQSFASTIDAGLQFAVARPALRHGDLAHRLQERSGGPADQIHRVERDRRSRVTSSAKRCKTAATTAGVDGAHGRRAGRRRGLDGRAGRGDGPLDPVVGGGNLRRRVRLSCADHGAVRRRPGGRGAGDGRRHGGRGRLGRHRHVAGPAGHADPRPSQRTHHAGRGGRRLSLAARRQRRPAAAPKRRRCISIPTTNFHVSALDSGSVSQWMRATARPC